MLISWKRLKHELCRRIADLAPASMSLTDILSPASAHPGERFLQLLVERIVRPERLAVPMMGNFAFQMVRSGFELGLFAYLKEHPGAKDADVREALQLTEHASDVLFVGLASLDLIHRIDDGLYNDPFLERVLQRGFNDDFFKHWLDFNHHLVRPASDYLYESIKADAAIGLKQTMGDVDSFYRALSLDPEKMKYFDGLMRAVTALNQDRVAALPAFGRPKRIIDVGGSTGSMAVAIARQHAVADVTVFDFPKVVEIAAQNFAKTPYGDRLHVIGGDLTKDPIPRGYECIFYGHMFGVFSEANNMKLLERAYEALDAGGTCIVHTPVLNENSDGPVSTGLFSSYFLFLANGHGRFYSPQRVRGWMERAGFRNVETIGLPAHEAALVGHK